MNQLSPQFNPQMQALNTYIEGCIEARLAHRPEPQPPVWLVGAPYQQAQDTIAMITGLPSTDEAMAYLDPAITLTKQMVEARELEPEDRTR